MEKKKKDDKKKARENIGKRALEEERPVYGACFTLPIKAHSRG
jgi:hypothetical protein